MVLRFIGIGAMLLAGCGGGSGDSSDAGPRPDAAPTCAPPQATPLATLGSDFFTDISIASGITDENIAPTPNGPLPRNDHSRVGLVDLDGDGCDDIVMHSTFPNADGGTPFEHLVFHNACDGTATFTNVSDASGLRTVQAGFFVFADIDGDGDQDCFAGLDTPLPGLGNAILLNDGQGHFTVKTQSGVEGTPGDTVAGNAVFADFDGDARLDLYIGNGHTSWLAADELYLGHGDGTFQNVTARLTGNRASPSNGSVACDYDSDGDLDVVVSVYGVSQGGAQDFLWENDGHGNFTNVAVARGVSSQGTGNTWLTSTGNGTQMEPAPAGPGTYIGGNGFGIACGDVDNDGDLDLFEGNISHPVSSDYSRKWSDPSLLLINGGNTFGNEFVARGLPFNEGDLDVAMADFDNDGLLDLSITRDKKYEPGYSDPEQKGLFGLMHQKTDHTFESVSTLTGVSTTPVYLHAGGSGSHGWSDLDHDGDLDVVMGEGDRGGGQENQLFRNDLTTGHHWLEVRLVGDGVHVPRDPLGTRVTVAYDGPRLTRELQSSRGMYAATDSRTLHFGLGDLACEGELIVRWTDGTVQTFSQAEVGTDRIITIDYASGLTTP